MLSHSVMFDSAIPWTVARQAPPSMRFSRILKQVAISFFLTQVSCVVGKFFTTEPTREASCRNQSYFKKHKLYNYTVIQELFSVQHCARSWGYRDERIPDLKSSWTIGEERSTDQQLQQCGLFVCSAIGSARGRGS